MSVYSSENRKQDTTERIKEFGSKAKEDKKPKKTKYNDQYYSKLSDSYKMI